MVLYVSQGEQELPGSQQGRSPEAPRPQLDSRFLFCALDGGVGPLLKVGNVTHHGHPSGPWRSMALGLGM